MEDMKRMTLASPRLRVKGVICAATLSLMLAGNAWAAPANAKFEPTLKVQGTALVLNGAGARYRTIFKVYELGLYTQRKADSPSEVIDMPGPKRLEFVAARELDSTDIGLAFVRGMKANATREQTTRYTPALAQLIDIFSIRSKISAGERFSMEYVPGKGTSFVVGGRAQGQPIGDAEFFSMVLKIWLGDSPVEPLLKDALLGQ